MPSPVTLPTASTPAEARVGTKTPQRVVVLDPRARLGEQRVRGLPAAGHDDEVAVDRVAVDDDAGAPVPSPPCASSSRAPSRRSTTRGTATPASRSSSAISSASSSAATHDGSLARPEREVPDQAANAVGQHHAREVVAGEDERLLDRAGRDDDPLGAIAVEDRAGIDRHEVALPDAERTGGREHLHALELGAPKTRALVHEHDTGPGRRGRERGRAPGLAAADDEHSRPAVLDVVAARVARVLVEPAEPGDAAQELLVQRPQLAAAGSSSGSRSRPA